MWWSAVEDRKKRRKLIKSFFRRKKRRLKQMAVKAWKLVPKKRKKNRVFDRKRAWERSTAKSIRGLKESLVRVEEEYFGNVSASSRFASHFLCRLLTTRLRLLPLTPTFYTQLSPTKPESVSEVTKGNKGVLSSGANLEPLENRGGLSAIAFGAFGNAGNKKKRSKPRLSASISAPRLNAVNSAAQGVHASSSGGVGTVTKDIQAVSRAELESMIEGQQEMISNLKDYVRRAQLNGTPVDPGLAPIGGRRRSHRPNSTEGGHAPVFAVEDSHALDTTTERLRRKISKVKRDAKSKILEERMRAKRLEKELLASMQRAEHLQNEVYSKAETVEGHKEELAMAMHKIKQINNQVSLVTMERDMLRKSVVSLKKALGE